MARTGRPIDAQREPLRLHGLLRKYDISQGELCRACTYESGTRAGQPLSTSTVSTLLTQQRWPRTVSFDSLKRQVAEFLRARGVDEAEIATCWNYENRAGAPCPPPTHSLIGELNPHVRGRHAAEPHDDFELPEKEMLSPTARQHFNIHRQPFVDEVQGPQDVYLSTDQRYVRESMYYAAKHGGLIAVVGESGSGKSTLRRDLVDRIRREGEPIVVIQPQTVDKSQLTAENIADSIVADLSLEKPRQSREARARQIRRILSDSARAGNSHVLLIEEAHDLSKATLKYLKRFWELEDGFKKLIGVIMIGQPELGKKLDERLNHDLRELIRRTEIAHLKPLDAKLEDYLTHKFTRIGARAADIFEPDAYDAIRARLTRRRPGSNEVESQVYPLVVQNFVLRCMNQAVELGLPKVSAELVGRV